MKSGKQRRIEIRDQRAKKRARRAIKRIPLPAGQALPHTAPCNAELLTPDNSYGVPAFVERGYYRDTSFVCKDCGRRELWTATQQKWWYEIAKGNVWTTAVRCRACRRKDRDRRAESRRVHQEGLAKKSRT